MRMAMTFTRVTAFAALLFCCTGPASAQAVRLEFHDGKVNLTTQNASMRAILAEWARLGGTQVVNAERLSGTPLTLQLTDVPEMQALDIILRGSAGYIAGLRPGTVETGTRSALDRIMVVPTAGTASTVVTRPATAPSPSVTTVRQPIQPPDMDANPDVSLDDNLPGGRPGVPITIQRGLQTPPQPFQPQDDDSPQPAPNSPVPSNPFGIQTGSSRPGTISPVPPQQAPRSPSERPSGEP